MMFDSDIYFWVFMSLYHSVLEGYATEYDLSFQKVTFRIIIKKENDNFIFPLKAEVLSITH